MINQLLIILANPTMKTNSKKLLFFLLCVTAIFSVGASASAFGAIDTLLNAKKKAEGFKEDAASRGICLRVDELSSKIEERMSQKEEQIEARIQNKLQEAEKNRGERDESLAEFRKNADEWREESYEKLEARAKTDEQKAAVEEFKKAIEAAVDVRRAAIDAAIDTFRGGVDEAWADHQSSIEGATNTYREAVRTAFEKAKSDCEEGVDAGTIRANLHTSLQAARGQLKEDKTGVTKLRDLMHDLIEAKRTAFEKAISDFKAAVEVAKKDLKESFPESGEDEEAG